MRTHNYETMIFWFYNTPMCGKHYIIRVYSSLQIVTSKTTYLFVEDPVVSKHPGMVESFPDLGKSYLMLSQSLTGQGS